MSRLRIRVGERESTAEWVDESPRTREAIEAALPLAGDCRTWGDELYFPTEVDVGPEDAREAVPVGAVAYWPAGNALCLFWGPTPASHGDEPRAAAPVNVVARIDDPDALVGVEEGDDVRLALD